MSRRTLIAVLTALVMAAAGLTVWVVVDDPDTSAPTSTAVGNGAQPTIKDGVYGVGSIPDPEAKEALEAAVEAVPAALSYDYRSLEASLKRATGFMTPAFAAEFTDIFDRTTRQRATDQEAVTTTLVRAAGVVTPTQDDTVRCLVYIDQFLLASKGAKPAKSYTVARVHVTVQKVDGDWKVSALEPF